MKSCIRCGEPVTGGPGDPLILLCPGNLNAPSRAVCKDCAGLIVAPDAQMADARAYVASFARPTRSFLTLAEVKRGRAA